VANTFTYLLIFLGYIPIEKNISLNISEAKTEFEKCIT